MPLDTSLEYEPLRAKPLPFWRRSSLLWGIICLNMWGMAFFGVLFIGLGIWRCFTRLDGSLIMFGRPVETHWQLAEWMVLNSVIAFVGIWFIIWQRKQRNGA